MTRYVAGFVCLAIVFLTPLGLVFRIGPLGWALLFLIVATGALAIAIARRSDRGLASPARCAECGGLISPNAPYCKHCGAIIT